MVAHGASGATTALEAGLGVVGGTLVLVLLAVGVVLVRQRIRARRVGVEEEAVETIAQSKLFCVKHCDKWPPN